MTHEEISKWSQYIKFAPYKPSIYRCPLDTNRTFPAVCILAEAPKVTTIISKHFRPQSYSDLLDTKTHLKGSPTGLSPQDYIKGD